MLRSAKEPRPVVDKHENMRVEVYECFEDIASMQPEWDGFVERNGADIFMTYDWCKIWWKYYGKGRRLKIFIFRNDQDIAGIIPVFFEKIWLGLVHVRAAKIVGSDFTLAQFCMPIHKGLEEDVFLLLFKMLKEELWDIFHLGPLSGLSENYDAIVRACRSSTRNTHRNDAVDRVPQVYFCLPESWDKQLEKLKKKERRDIKRNYRNLERALSTGPDSVKVTFADDENIDEYFREFVVMHQINWTQLGAAGHFSDWPRAREFHLEVSRSQLKHDRLRLCKMNCEDCCLGYEYDYWFGHTCFELLASRSHLDSIKHISVGKLNYCEKIKKCIENGITTIDSMRGHYKYKIRLGGEIAYIKSLYLISNSVTTRIRVALFRFLARLLNILYYRIWYCKVSRKMPHLKHGLWSLWIRVKDLA